MTLDSTFESFAAARMVQLMAFALRLTGNEADAQDLVQEALIRTGVRWRSIRRVDQPEVYVQTVMTRLHVDNWRKTRRESLAAEPREGALTEEDREAAIDLRRAMTRLARGQRAVLVLRYYADFTEAQTAEALGCALGTVKSQTSDALRNLRSILAVPSESPERDHR